MCLLPNTCYKLGGHNVKKNPSKYARQLKSKRFRGKWNSCLLFSFFLLLCGTELCPSGIALVLKQEELFPLQLLQKATNSILSHQKLNFIAFPLNVPIIRLKSINGIMPSELRIKSMPFLPLARHSSHMPPCIEVAPRTCMTIVSP